MNETISMFGVAVRQLSNRELFTRGQNSNISGNIPIITVAKIIIIISRVAGVVQGTLASFLDVLIAGVDII